MLKPPLSRIAVRNYYKAIIRQKPGKSLHHACRIIAQSCQGSDPFAKGYVPFGLKFQNILAFLANIRTFKNAL